MGVFVRIHCLRVLFKSKGIVKSNFIVIYFQEMLMQGIHWNFANIIQSKLHFQVVEFS